MMTVSKLLHSVGLGSAKPLPPPAPLAWHSVHGSNIRLGEERAVAARVGSFCNAVVFTSRPLRPGEKVFMRLTTTAGSATSQPGWSGGLRLGLSSAGPRNWEQTGLPRYLCPDMTRANSKTVWGKAVPEKLCQHGSVLSFHYRRTGDLILAVNGEERGVFLSGVRTGRPLWAVVDVYGSVDSVELVDPRAGLRNIMASKPTDPYNIMASKPTDSNTIDPSHTALQQEKRAQKKLAEICMEQKENWQPQRPASTCSSSYSTSRSTCSPASLSSRLDMDSDLAAPTECVICYESGVDCVLYSCGHMCMCFQCAVQQWSGTGECPLCRATIRDVIRTYRA